MLVTYIFCGRHPPLHRDAPIPSSSQIRRGTAIAARSKDWPATNKGIGNSQHLDSQGWYAQLVKQQTICRFLLMAAV